MSDCCKVCNALENAINNCNRELQKIRDGTMEMPESCQRNPEIFNNLLEERHEYLEGFKSKLEFLLNNENRGKMQV